MYRVTFDKAHEEPLHIATARKFAKALAATKKAGALLQEGKGSGQDFASRSPDTKETTISRSGYETRRRTTP